MKLVSLSLASVSIIAICLVTASPVRADDGGDGNFRLNRYVVTNLTSDVPGVALNTDPVLQNSWGVAFSPGASPFWIADNATGCSTLYDGQGAIASALQVKIPLPGGSIPSTACMPINAPPPPNGANKRGFLLRQTRLARCLLPPAKT